MKNLINDIKVGDYVRNKNGYIGKILDFCECEECEKREFYEPILDTKEFYITNLDKECNFEGLKFSPNIIDLIEVGDIVNYEQINGGVVLNKKDNEIDTWSILPSSLKNEDIKSVITREQLKDMEYKIER